MEEFSLEKYQTSDYDVVTRDGRKARILCVDRKAGDCHYIVALIEQDDTDSILSYKLNGHYNYYDNDEPDDLMLEKKLTKLKYGERYWCITSYLGKIEVIQTIWSNEKSDETRLKQWNCFKTEEEVKEKLNQILEILKR